LIKRSGGTPLVKYGFDGKINGRHVEVRCCRKDKRFGIRVKVTLSGSPLPRDGPGFPVLTKNVHEILRVKPRLSTSPLP